MDTESINFDHHITGVVGAIKNIYKQLWVQTVCQCCQQMKLVSNEFNMGPLSGENFYFVGLG